MSRKKIFQSTRPVWGATIVLVMSGGDVDISIHAPRVGRDRKIFTIISRALEFQSTRPVWGATLGGCYMSRKKIFQSTRPVWGATLC